MTDSLKKKTVKGLLWSGTEKVAYEAIQFIVGIVLARILTPSDYGAVGLIMVFITFSHLFIDGGLTTALIQKINRTEDDYNTVFIFNLVISLFLYITIFLVAPFIASFYEMDELSPLLRILSIVLVISPFSSVQITQLTINVDFRRIAIVSVPSAIISGVIGILMAYWGFGAYSIVFQQVLMVFIRSVLVNIVSKYRIKLFFSKESFKDLFSFSYKLVLSSSLDRLYSSAYTMIIGKVFNPATLGLFTQGTLFPSVISSLLGDIFNRVAFPVMSSVQYDKNQLKVFFEKYIQASSFVIFSVLICLFIVAKPLVILLLTEKWIEAVPILKWMCIAWMTDHICTLNRNILYTQKRSDLALKLELFKKITAFIIFLSSLPFGVIGVCIGQAIYGVFATFLNSYYTKSLIGITIKEQTIAYGKILIIATFAGCIPYYLMDYFQSNIVQILFVIMIYIILFVTLNSLFQTHPYLSAKEELMKYTKRINYK